MIRRCKLCRNLADMSYEVDRAQPVPLCGTCMGKHEPTELNRLLGVVPEGLKGIPREKPKECPDCGATYIGTPGMHSFDCFAKKGGDK